MKKCLIITGLLTFYIQAYAAPPKLDTVVDCELASPKNTISLLRGSLIVDSYIYKIRTSKKNQFIYEDAESSRGSAVQWQCVSGQNNLNFLVFTGEFTSNFLQGALFYFDSTHKKIERINFAERNRPRWIRVSGRGPEVIFENTKNESSHKYLSYGKKGTHFEFDEFPATSSKNTEKLIELNNFKP